LNRIADPLVDRIDRHVEVPAVKFADLAATDQVEADHMAEAVQYRSLDRQWCG